MESRGTALIEIGQFFYDKIKDGWDLVENAEMLKIPIIPISNFEIVSFLQKGEGGTRILGEEMRLRAKKLGANLYQEQAEYLLEHQADIPEEWRKYSFIFPGTVWRDPLGDLRVPFLGWNGSCWDMFFYLIKLARYDGIFLLRPRSK